ncbi:MAG: tetratricopeptide repeat protein [Bacteroidales bacterium]|nr:tetratricopeptide repeat protein [Bacteroidales bacterium]
MRSTIHPVLILLLLVFSFFPLVKAVPQNRQVVDSLKQVIDVAKDDTNKVKLLFEIGEQYTNFAPDTALYHFQNALDLSQSIKAKSFIAKSLIRIGVTIQNRGSYEDANEYFQQALKLAEEISDLQILSSAYVNIGLVHHDQGSYDLAIEYYNKSLKSAFEINYLSGLSWSYNNLGRAYYDKGSYENAIEFYLNALDIDENRSNKRGMSKLYNNIGLIHYELKSYNKAIEYLQKALETNEELGRRLGMAICNHNLGMICHKQGTYDMAINHYLLALELFEELGHKIGISNSTQNIGSVYLDQDLYDKAIEFYFRALITYEELDDKMGIAIININIANLNIDLADSVAKTQIQRLNYLNKAVVYGNKSISLAREMHLIPVEKDASNSLMKAYGKLGNYKKSLEYAEIYISAQDSMFQVEKTKAIQEMATKYETEKKQQQIELQETQLVVKDAKIKQQKILRNSLIGGIAAIALIIVIVILAYLQKKRDNKKIVLQNEKILDNNEELKKLNEAVTLQKDEIISSINYAQRIQSAILPPETYITELLNENFIFYKPKDIVSGDFYWIKQVNQYIVLVAADCTGHGVPGAFMSMLGISYLNEIVQRREITQANEVLNELRKQIKQSLRQSGQRHESRDGIDIALCVIDTKNNIMQYAGAYNPLYLICTTNGKPELKEIKADKMPVGVHFSKDKSFTNHEIKLELGDIFYIFSDGFVDQIGGEDNNRFRSKLLKKLLLDIHDQPMYEQKEALERSLKDWMGEHPQRDDILVIGARV